MSDVARVVSLFIYLLQLHGYVALGKCGACRGEETKAKLIRHFEWRRVGRRSTIYMQPCKDAAKTQSCSTSILIMVWSTLNVLYLVGG